MSLINTLRYILNHPFNSDNKLESFLRFVKWQINCRLNPYPIIYNFTQNSKLIIWKGLRGATGNLYCGLMEYSDMGFLLHFLRPNDLFIDIGANIGSYTVLASAEVKANSISIEPIPNTFANLINNISINKIEDRVNALNIGIGGKSEVLNFSESYDCTNHVVGKDQVDSIEVNVNTLDSILAQKHNPVLIKIDVEGFETEVLNGAESTLEKGSLKAIIIELNGSGMRYNYDERLIHYKLIQHGFSPFDYNPKTKQLRKLKMYGKHNTIYLRDLDFVEKRICSSRSIMIGKNGII